VRTCPRATGVGKATATRRGPALCTIAARPTGGREFPHLHRRFARIIGIIAEMAKLDGRRHPALQRIPALPTRHMHLPQRQIHLLNSLLYPRRERCFTQLPIRPGVHQTSLDFYEPITCLAKASAHRWNPPAAQSILSGYQPALLRSCRPLCAAQDEPRWFHPLTWLLLPSLAG